MSRVRLILALLGCALPLAAQQRLERYALILPEDPVAVVAGSREGLRTATAAAHRSRIQSAQSSLRGELERRSLTITGAVDTVLNAVFVAAPASREAELKGLSGVQRVVKLRWRHPTLDHAVQLTNIPAAWNTLGGVGSAGQGVKIAIIDTGIDLNHPAFQDSSLPAASGFPKCSGTDCNFTNQKIIVARSYISMVAAGSDPNNPAVDSKPDDLSPRDHVGHGTAVASVAAGNTNTGPLATITGVAPKAYLGNYKIFGTPGINDGTSDDAIVKAIDDAVSDGMDVAVMSLGGPAALGRNIGPLDTGRDCGAPSTQYCDPTVQAVENAVKAGMSVVVAAGNDGEDGYQYAVNGQPSLGTADSPGIAPSAIAVAASTNSHEFFNTVSVQGGPSNISQINALFGDGPLPAGPVSAPAVLASKVGAADACSALPANSLSGVFALVSETGNCTFVTQVLNAQNAGAIGVILYLTDIEPLFPFGGLVPTTIPTVLIGNTDEQNLLSFITSQPSAKVTLDPALRSFEVSTYNTMADFSSRGPSVSSNIVKPEVTAVGAGEGGAGLYMAAQKNDPSGELYSANGYTAADGTSFSTPMVAGAIALVKQKNQNFTPAQLKSAVVNTATQDVTDYNGSAAHVQAVGAGKLNGGNAVNTNITVSPATLSFGVVTSGAQPVNQTLTITNTGGSPVNLTLSFQANATDTRGQLSVNPSSLTLAPGQSTTVTATLAGSLPSAGSYDGALLIQGGAQTLRVPYLYLVGNGVPYDVLALTGQDDLDGNVGDTLPGALILKVVDQYGAPVPNATVTFRVYQGGGTVANADRTTDNYGIAYADFTFGSTPGDVIVLGQYGRNMAGQFFLQSRLQPTIAPNGAVNAASFDVGQGLAPGSYISLFGTGLSDGTKAASTVSLPLSLDLAGVSFDVPGKLSVPGHLYYVSPNQVNLQIPWELQGSTSAQIKVSIQDSLGKVYTLPIAQYSPGIFQFTESSSGRSLAAAEDASGNVLGTGNPATRGSVITLYVNGLGPVSNQPASGEPAPSSPLSATLTTPTVTIGGQTAAVQFSGLAPGYAGLYQINVTVPSSAATGVQPVTVAIGGVTSKSANLVIQ